MGVPFDPSKVKITWGPHALTGFTGDAITWTSTPANATLLGIDTSGRGAAVASTDVEVPGFAAARDRFVQVLAELEHLDPGCTHPCNDDSGRARFSFGYPPGRYTFGRKLYLELTVLNLGGCRGWTVEAYAQSADYESPGVCIDLPPAEMARRIFTSTSW